jgi:hypothetical protein
MSYLNLTSNELFEELEKPRMPQEMYEYFYFVFNAVQHNEQLMAEARLKKGGFKKFLEEFFPLYCYSQSSYCNTGSKLNIILGNQGYDAVSVNLEGIETFFEITSFINGEQQYKNAIELNRDGISSLNFLSNEIIEEYKDGIIANLERKGLKDYTGVNLILVVDTSLHFEVLNIGSLNFIKAIISIIEKMNFSFKEIYLLHEVGNTKDNIEEHFHRIK